MARDYCAVSWLRSRTRVIHAIDSVIDCDGGVYGEISKMRRCSSQNSSIILIPASIIWRLFVNLLIRSDGVADSVASGDVSSTEVV